MEQVPGFREKIDKLSETSFLDLFLEEASSYGYVCQDFVMRHGDWSELQRDRIYVVGLDDEIGGMTEVINIVQEAKNFRVIWPPTKLVGTVIDPHRVRDYRQDIGRPMRGVARRQLRKDHYRQLMA
jgi:hypothetical protein